MKIFTLVLVLIIMATAVACYPDQRAEVALLQNQNAQLRDNANNAISSLNAQNSLLMQQNADLKNQLAASQQALASAQSANGSLQSQVYNLQNQPPQVIYRDVVVPQYIPTPILPHPRPTPIPPIKPPHR
jgi:hypothetical protein